MNVLHLSSAQSWRGGEQQLLYLIKGLNENKVSNHLLCPVDAPLAQYPLNDLCYLHTYRKLSSFNPIASIQLLLLTQKKHIDIVHVHDSHAHNYAITAASLGMKCPIIISRKVDFPTRSKNKYNHQSIKAIICVSDHVKSILEPIIDDKRKLHVVHDAIDPGKRTNKKINLRGQYSIPEDHTLIANISALADHKDYPTFLRTARHFDQSSLKCTFMIIGADAGEKEKLFSLWEEMKIETPVIFTGFLPEAHPGLNEIDIFLFTSKEEGMGSTLLDAMLYEVPIVCTDAGGIKELITHQFNGLMTSVGNDRQLAEYIQSIIENRRLANQLTQNALTFIATHTYKDLADKTLNIYQDILNN